MDNKRRGKGYNWSLETKTCMGKSISSGFTVDNLDTKTISEAENCYEKVFITIRESLKEIDSLCLDEEDERLQCAQTIADALRTGALIRRTP